MHKLKRLFVAGAHCQLLMAKTDSTFWANVLLKCQDAVLGKVNDNMSFNSFMDSHDLLCRLALDKVVQKSSHVFHNEVICKVVSLEKLAKAKPKKLHFCQQSREAQSAKCSGPRSSQLVSGRVPLQDLACHLPRPRLPPSKHGRGKRF